MPSTNPRRISYILCTKNKLPQLKCTVPDLLAGCTQEDEIIVFDGQSTDGSQEYLHGLFEEGKFSVYRSEPDRNQAHALNKAIFCARGEIIKVVLDDDVLDYGFMQKCADFFRTHPEIDALGANIGLAGDPGMPPIVWDLSRQQGFESWLKGGKPFWFQDQSFTYRRSSIPIVGLWHTGVNCIDVEMTLRLTSLRQTKLAWHTGNVAVRITNAASLSLHAQYVSKVPADLRRIHVFYGVECPPEWRLPGSTFEKIRNAARLRTRLRNLLKAAADRKKGIEPPEPGDARPFAEIYKQCKQWLSEKNQGGDHQFLR